MTTMKKIGANNIFNIYKPAGISPLDAIKLLKEKHPELKNEKMTYAGRLDPMAEGALLILAGNAIYEKERYLKMDKEYEGEILFGFETDTCDVLGLPEKIIHYRRSMSIVKIRKILKSFEGEISLPLPPYSSYKIKGKPLFQWAREGKLSEIETPIRQTKINSAKLLSLNEISDKNLMETIKQKISLIKGDFRQKEILSQWQKMLPKSCWSIKTVTFQTAKIKGKPFVLTSLERHEKETLSRRFSLAKIKISCSSGTYIRSIAHHLGQELKTGGILLNLKRTKVGNFDIKDSEKIKSY